MNARPIDPAGDGRIQRSPLSRRRAIGGAAGLGLASIALPSAAAAASVSGGSSMSGFDVVINKFEMYRAPLTGSPPNWTYFYFEYSSSITTNAYTRYYHITTNDDSTKLYKKLAINDSEYVTDNYEGLRPGYSTESVNLKFPITDTAVSGPVKVHETYAVDNIGTTSYSVSTNWPAWYLGTWHVVLTEVGSNAVLATSSYVLTEQNYAEPIPARYPV